MINNKSSLALDFWHSGRLDDCPILDFHGHMHVYSGIYFPAAGPQCMIKTMERCNSKLTIFCSHLPLLESADFEEEYNLNTVKKYPEYFLAYHSIMPGVTDFDDTIDRFEKNKEYYFGFKFHPDSHLTPITDNYYAPFLEYISANKLPALIHTWGHSPYNGVDEIKEIAGKYTDAIFICGHCFHDDWLRGTELASDYPNLIYELTAVTDNYGVIEMLCEKVGSERILFGTDLPWFDTHQGIGAVLSADINDDDMRNIFYRNGIKLLENQAPGLSEKYINYNALIYN